jgi:hypothetical protein
MRRSSVVAVRKSFLNPVAARTPQTETASEDNNKHGLIHWSIFLQDVGLLVQKWTPLGSPTKAELLGVVR